MLMKVGCEYRIGFLVCALLPLSSNAARAQVATAESTCTYERCALWIDGAAVRRGAGGVVVLRDGLFRPMRLRDLVGGADSAGYWASSFERRARVGQVFTKAGLAAFVVGAGAQYIRLRNSTNSRDDATAVEFGLVLSGTASVFVGSFIRRTANPLRSRAVWWYNRRFAR